MLTLLIPYISAFADEQIDGILVGCYSSNISKSKVDGSSRG